MGLPCLLKVDVLQGTASVRKGGQSKDHRDSVMINYRNSDAVILRPMLDELRRVRPAFPSVKWTGCPADFHPAPVPYSGKWQSK
jgi:hypothetical protein